MDSIYKDKITRVENLGKVPKCCVRPGRHDRNKHKNLIWRDKMAELIVQFCYD